MMKQRVTLTIAPGIVRHARRVAHARHTTVSGLVEALIRQSSAEREPTSFVDRWAGRFKVAGSVRGDRRGSELRKRYGLASS